MSKMSWKMEVIADTSGKWCGNALRFATKREAADYALDLTMRWFAVKASRTVRCRDPVNYEFKNGRLTALD